MRKLNIAIIPSLALPPKEAQLVMFCDPKNYVSQYDSSNMLAAAARYAKRHGVFLVPEMFSAADYLCMCIFSPEGKVIGAQRAIHLNLDYRGVFHRDDSVSTIDTPFGKIALIVDVDINKPQVVKSAVANGAELLLSMQYIHLFDFFEDRISCGAVNAAQSNKVSVVSASNHGGIIINSSGKTVSGFSEDYPLKGTVNLGHTDDRYLFERGIRLLTSHEKDIDDSLKAGEDIE